MDYCRSESREDLTAVQFKLVDMYPKSYSQKDSGVQFSRIEEFPFEELQFPEP